MSSDQSDKNTSRHNRQISDADEPDLDVLEEAGHASSRKLIIWLLCAVFLLAFMHFTEPGRWLQDQLQDGDAVMALLSAGGNAAILLFIALAAGLVFVGVPRLLVFALSGFLFDVVLGLTLAMVSSLIGSFIAFRAARWAGRAWCQKRLAGKKYFKRIVEVRPTTTAVAITRMLPLSNIIINVGLAMSRVRNRAFIFGTLVGFLPQGIIAVLIGAGVAEDSLLEGLAQIILAALLTGAMTWVMMRRKLNNNGKT